MCDVLAWPQRLDEVTNTLAEYGLMPVWRWEAGRPSKVLRAVPITERERARIEGVSERRRVLAEWLNPFDGGAA